MFASMLRRHRCAMAMRVPAKGALPCASARRRVAPRTFPRYLQPWSPTTLSVRSRVCSTQRPLPSPRDSHLTPTGETRLRGRCKERILQDPEENDLPRISMLRSSTPERHMIVRSTPIEWDREFSKQCVLPCLLAMTVMCGRDRSLRYVLSAYVTFESSNAPCEQTSNTCMLLASGILHRSEAIKSRNSGSSESSNFSTGRHRSLASSAASLPDEQWGTHNRISMCASCISRSQVDPLRPANNPYIHL
jgi:hypothetical protein